LIKHNGIGGAALFEARLSDERSEVSAPDLKTARTVLPHLWRRKLYYEPIVAVPSPVEYRLISKILTQSGFDGDLMCLVRPKDGK
jgi:hypothetical protein